MIDELSDPKHKNQQQQYFFILVREMENRVNKDCFIHRRTCRMLCTYQMCEVKIICEKCLTDHLKLHPRHFIYNVENLGEIHAFQKLGRLKQSLGREKMSYEQKIVQIYSPFQLMLSPLNRRVKQFEKQSKDLITKELLKHLVLNKTIIQNCKIIKSDPLKAKLQPQVMIQEIIAQVNLVNTRENQMKENTERFMLYMNLTEQLGKSIQKEVKKMSQKMIKFFDHCLKIQASHFRQQGPPQEQSYDNFFHKYTDRHRIASKVENNNLELTLLQFKRIIQQREQEVKFAKQENLSLLNRIQQLNKVIQRLKAELYEFKTSGEREERERKEAISIARQKMEEYLIRNQVVFNQSRSISVQKKNMDIKFVDVLLTMVKNPIELVLSQHCLSQDQLARFVKDQQNSKFSLKPVKILRMSFMPIDKQFLIKAFNFYENVHTLELNSCNMNDQALEQISGHFPAKLKHLHLIDNQLTDDGLEKMLITSMKRHINFESLFLSYNNFTDKAVDALVRSSWEIKTLHISKNQIKNKGSFSIARGLRYLEELFIGGTGTTKEGIIAICKTCLNLKRFSIVATQISTEAISQILLGLPKLEWLDISYSNLTETDLKIVQKLKIYNKAVQIIAQF